MYKFYFDKTLFPIAPEKLTTKINGNNKTMKLANGSEMNFLKMPGLTEVSFELLLPNSMYPFATYKNNSFKNAKYFLDVLEKFKTNAKPFRFIVIREMRGQNLFDTNMNVSLEKYSIVEDAENGADIKVSIELKQFDQKQTKIFVIPTETNTVTFQSNIIPDYMKDPNYAVTGLQSVRDASNALGSLLPNPYTVQEGDTMWNVCKKFYGDGGKSYVVYPYNNITTGDPLTPGQKIYFPT